MNQQVSSKGKTIALNKRARYDYHIEERLEAGISLEGWEVKSLRAGQLQFADSLYPQHPRTRDRTRHEHESYCCTDGKLIAYAAQSTEKEKQSFRPPCTGVAAR
jgi:hypothetical protein